jgi:hypothetical protein
MIVSIASYAFALFACQTEFIDVKSKHAEFAALSSAALEFVHEATDNEIEFASRERWFRYYFDDNYEKMCSAFCYDYSDDHSFMTGPVTKKFINWKSSTQPLEQVA